MSCYLGNDIRDIKALEAFKVGSYDHQAYLNRVKAAGGAYVARGGEKQGKRLKRDDLKLGRGYSRKERRVYGLLAKDILASGEMLPFTTRLFPRIRSLEGINIPDNERTLRRWASKVKDARGIACN